MIRLIFKDYRPKHFYRYWEGAQFCRFLDICMKKITLRSTFSSLNSIEFHYKFSTKKQSERTWMILKILICSHTHWSRSGKIVQILSFLTVKEPLICYTLPSEVSLKIRKKSGKNLETRFSTRKLSNIIEFKICAFLILFFSKNINF